ncbi:MAG TPA: RNB domain-containing ribonuclease [Acetobacteraceae bacterium]
MPETTIIHITGTDPDGDALGRPASWDAADGPPPIVFMRPERPGQPALAPGERVLARLRPLGAGRYEGRTIHRLASAPRRILGVFRPGPRENRLVPTDRRAKAEWIVPPGEDGGAAADEIVLAEPLPHHNRFGLRPARVIERLGNMGDARSVSLIAIHTHDIPVEFPDAAVAEAERARATALGHRTDLRDIPLVTIDGADARDFDDAVFAEPDAAGGFRLIVAIADVAHYVRPGSALDHAARTRGNSVYFPDRVVPMLPEALSNGWCSLRPGEDRGCLFVELHIDAGGRKTAHRFGRGLMRSAARLTYEQAQAGFEAGETRAERRAETPSPLVGEGRGEGSHPHRPSHGEPLSLTLPLKGGGDAFSPPAIAAIPHLHAAYRALLAARTARGTLDLDLPERAITLDAHGQVTNVAPRPRLDSHRLIEEFMILANVAAAEELERRRQPAMYRIHAPPSDEKLQSLRDFLHTLDISLPPGNQIHPRDLDHVLRRVAGTPHAPVVNEVMLRSQSQAAYNPDNIGHFGLALPRYVHFTSPIRRYADLLVHRALIRGLQLGADGLGADGLGDDEAAGFEAAADHITATERRAQLAERDATDRYLAAYMADKTGAHFAARISGVTRFALFVTVAESGASGIVPVSTLPDDYWRHDEREQTLTGRHTRLVFRLAQEVEVRLAEASPVTGGLVFHVLQGMPRPGKRSHRR